MTVKDQAMQRLAALIALVILPACARAQPAALNAPNTFTQIQSIVGNPEGRPSYKNDTWLGVTGPDDAYTTISIIAFGGKTGAYPGLHLERYDGTKAAIAPVAAGAIIGAVAGDAWNGKGDTTNSALTFITTEGQTPLRNGTGLNLWYTPNGSTAFTLGAGLSQGGRGGFTVGDDKVPDLGPGTVNASAGVATEGHFRSRGPAPRLSACGSGSTLDGADGAGQVANGGAVGSCAVTLAKAYESAPVCIVQNYANPTPAPFLTSFSPAGFTVSWSAPYSGVWFYICQGRS
jgi:hypothetical protein